MTFCLVYEEVQTKLIEKIECNALVDQILWNAVFLVQGLWFIENGDRFSPKDDRVFGNFNQFLNHVPGYRGFGVDDFQSADRRTTSYLKWFEHKHLTDDANIIFLNVELMAQIMNERYNDLKNKYLPLLSIERTLVTYRSSTRTKRWSTNIFTPLYHLSPEQKTMPLWVNKSVWKLFLESEYEFNNEIFHRSITETPNDSEKKLYTAIEKMKTIGKLNYETVTTKAVMTKPQTEHEKKANEFDQMQKSSKKVNEGGEKTDSSDKEFVINEKKAVQKADSSNVFFEENKPATSKDDFEKNKLAHKNGNEHIEEVMKQKGIKLHLLIIEVLSDGELNKINEIKTNIEATPLETYRQFGTKKWLPKHPYLIKYFILN
jgi:hypothetical protein